MFPNPPFPLRRIVELPSFFDYEHLAPATRSFRSDTKPSMLPKHYHFFPRAGGGIYCSQDFQDENAEAT